MYFMIKIKSNSLKSENKDCLLIPMEVDKTEYKNYGKDKINKKIIEDASSLYPQYTKKDDEPIFSITKESKKIIFDFVKTGIYRQRSVLNKFEKGK